MIEIKSEQGWLHEKVPQEEGNQDNETKSHHLFTNTPDMCIY